MNKNLLIFFIPALFLILALLNIGYPSEYYFDENYTAFTAVNIAQNNNLAIWQSAKTPVDPPRGFEWSHPPLARLTIAASIKIFGSQSWAWRLPSVTASTLSLILIYLIGKKLYSTQIGILAAFLMSIDGLSFAQSRIATSESLLFFLILLSTYLSLKKKAVLSILTAGLAVSTKWSAVPLLPLLIFLNKNHKNFRIFLFQLILLPPAVYLITYFPMFLAQAGITDFLNLQVNMLTHGISSSQIHPHQSPWWIWPIGFKPIPYYSKNSSQIWAMPNFAVFLIGLSALLNKLLEISKAKSLFPKKSLKSSTVPLLGYFAFISPWIIISLITQNSRTTYLYYYLPSLAFLHLITADWLSTLLKKKQSFQKIFATTALLAMTLVFLYTYPALIGI